MKTYYILRGRVTDVDAHGGRAELGDTEWQFSDHPYSRSSSADFLSVEEGIRELSPAIFVHEDRIPPLSPLEADAAIRASRRDPLVVCGWAFYMDGPMNTPWDYLAPTALPPSATEPEDCLYCSGEPGDPIDADTIWVRA